MVRRAVITGSVLLVALGAAVVLPRSCVQSPAQAQPASRAPAALSFAQVTVQDATTDGLTLDGEIRDVRGAPVANAEVSLASTAQPSLRTVTCDEDHLPVLSCPARESAQTVERLLLAGDAVLKPGATARTDAAGKFRFDHLLGVSFTVWAQAPGLGTAVRERAAPGEPVRLVLPPARSLSGEVEDELGHSVPGARLWALSRRLALPHAAVADGRGRFELGGLGEGPFEVLASAPGYLPRVVRDLDAAGDRVHVTLERPRALEVAVTRAGKPAEALVRLQGDHLVREARTQNGVARFDQLYPDGVMITAEAAGAAASPRAETLSLPLTHVELPLEAGGSLLVTAVDEAGQPVPEPRVSLLTPFAEPLRNVAAQTGAVTAFGPVAVGDYRVRVSAEGYQTAEVPAVVKGSSTPVEVQLLKGIAVTGKVLDEYDRPLPDVSVWVEPIRESAVTNARGEFTALVPTEGAYTLEVQHSQWGGARRTVTAPASGVELHLAPKASAEVRVTADGLPLEGANVTLVAEGEGSAYRSDAPSGSDGRVLMRGLEPGTYQLIADHPRYLASEKQQVTLVENAPLKLEVALHPGASIRGQVVDERGLPIAGADVATSPQSPRLGRTDGDGRFEMQPLKAGETYRVEVHHPRYDLLGDPQAVPGGDPLRLVMQEKARVRGRVVSDDGQPVRRFEVDGEAFSASDGHFEAHVSRGGERVSFVVAAPGYEPDVVEQAQGDDVGTVVLHRSPEITGLVREQGGAPVEGAVVTCGACDDVVMTDAAGHFALSHPGGLADLSVTAKKGRLSGTAKIGEDSSRPLVIELPPLVHLTGRVYLADGTPASGRALEAFDADRSELVTIVTGQDGSYATDLPAGSYRIPVNPGEATIGVPLAFVSVHGEAMHLDLGPAPGTGSLTVHVMPAAGRALWVVPGAPQVADPPTDLFRMPFGQLIYQPQGDTVTVQGLPPGRYTVVWANQHMETPGGPAVRVVDVTGQQDVSMLQ